MIKAAKLAVSLLVLILLCVNCGQFGKTAAEREATETRLAAQYPWVYYPIDQESKAELCQAFKLSVEEDICDNRGKEVYFGDVLKIVRRQFPVEHTTYDEVEALLGEFPHLTQETLRSDGALVSLRHIYRLTNYEGACISFYVKSETDQTITKINASSIAGGLIPTTCGPTE